MSKVIVQGFIIVPDDDLDAVSAELPTHISATRSESGCLVFEVTASSEQPGRFDVYEEFTDATAFEHHQRRVADSQWGRVTQNVSRHYEITGTQV
jgi:quinol monooxygenase YgiN